MSQSVKRKVKVYTPEFRTQAIKLILEQGGNIVQTAENLGIPPGTLNNWVCKIKNGKWSLDSENVTALKIDHNDRSPPTKPGYISQKLHDQLIAEQKKSAELERQVRRLTMEREILKKAMAYCLDAPK